jgi:hypothetical protein
MATFRYPDEVGYRAHLDNVMAETLVSRLIQFCLFNYDIFTVELIIALTEFKEAEC